MKIDFEQVVKVKSPEDLAKEQLAAEALAYLASTDWYVLRFVENGKSVPKDVTAAREVARAHIEDAQNAA